MSEIYKDDNSEEWYFPQNSYILSETDDKGFILYANDMFCKIAGYKIEDLIGKPHNIVRHPDMPRIAFAGLWEDVKTKGFWIGTVKNRRKDGGYYWVNATALKNTHSDGHVTYLSIRRVPSRTTVDACISLYADLKNKE